MKYVVRYTVVASRAADLAAVYPRHKAYLDAFVPANELVGIGTFDDLVINGSMAVFETLDSAERFVTADPFVVEGLVVASAPLGWNA